MGGVVAGIMVVVLVVGLIVIATNSVPGTAPVAARTPEQVVEKFFDALQEHDAEAAIALQAGEVPASELLTDEVLRRSQEIAPISDVSVKQTGDASVHATYRLGTEEAQADFPVVQNEDGDWQLAHVTTTVQVTRPTNVPVLVNDVELTADSVEAFPGAYLMTTSLTRIEYDAEPFLVQGPESFPVLEPQPRLSAEGITAFRENVEEALAACMERRELEPEGCPQLVTAGSEQEVDPATIRWTLIGDPVADIDPYLSEQDQTMAEADMVVTVALSAHVKSSEAEGTVTTEAEFHTMARGSVVNDPIKVRFE